jgi:hypothetical protein
MSLGPISLLVHITRDVPGCWIGCSCLIVVAVTRVRSMGMVRVSMDITTKGLESHGYSVGHRK